MSAVVVDVVAVRVPEGSWRSEARAIEGKFGRGIVATKNITNLSHASWALPAPLVALLLQ